MTVATKPKRTAVEKSIDRFLCALRQRNASVHTIKAYTQDLNNFAAYIGSRNWRNIDHLAIRGFLSVLYEKDLDKTSVARALAAVRSFYRWLAQEGLVEQNPAALVSTPKLPKKLPRVPTIEEMNMVLDGEMPEVASFPERDRIMFELLYGCGIRNSELVGINLDDIRLSSEAILIRGKGKKERYVPFGDSVKAALTGLPAGAPTNIGWTPEEYSCVTDQSARRPAYHSQRGPHHQEDRCSERPFTGCASAHAAPRLRHAHARGGGRLAFHPGNARP